MPKSAPNLASKPTTATAGPAPTTSPPPTTTTTTTTTSEPAWLTGPALKAANEHTYAIQRAKKAADRAKAKAPPRKAPGAAVLSMSYSARGGGGGGGGGGGATAAMASVWAEVWDARKASAADDDMDWPELPTPLSLSLSQRCWSPTTSPAECALRPTQDREVPLSALVRPVKARGVKAKGKRRHLNVGPADDQYLTTPPRI